MVYGLKKTKGILPFIKKTKFIPSSLIPVSPKIIKDMMNQIAQKKRIIFFIYHWKKHTNVSKLCVCWYQMPTL